MLCISAPTPPSWITSVGVITWTNDLPTSVDRTGMDRGTGGDAARLGHLLVHLHLSDLVGVYAKMMPRLKYCATSEEQADDSG